jgi:hypothetical protein
MPLLSSTPKSVLNGTGCWATLSCCRACCRARGTKARRLANIVVRHAAGWGGQALPPQESGIGRWAVGPLCACGDPRRASPAWSRLCVGSEQPAPISSSERLCCLASRFSGGRERCGSCSRDRCQASLSNFRFSPGSWRCRSPPPRPAIFLYNILVNHSSLSAACSSHRGRAAGGMRGLHAGQERNRFPPPLPLLHQIASCRRRHPRRHLRLPLRPPRCLPCTEVKSRSQACSVRNDAN